MSMPLYMRELKAGLKSLLIWSVSLGLFTFAVILMYNSIIGKVDTAYLIDMLKSMGGLDKLFGMAELGIDNILHFYGIECGMMLIIGLSMYCGALSANMISKEEFMHTSEFLLAHPVSRQKIYLTKAAAIFSNIAAINVFQIVVAILGFAAVKADYSMSRLLLLHFTLFVMSLEIGAICFGLSAFARRNMSGVGIGIAVLAYALTIPPSFNPDFSFLNYFTPASYAQAADTIGSGTVLWAYLFAGILTGAAFFTAGLYKYVKKDIAG